MFLESDLPDHAPSRKSTSDTVRTVVSPDICRRLLYRILVFLYQNANHAASKVASCRRSGILWDCDMRSSDKNGTGDKSQVQVIARAAAILRALEDEAPGLSLGQIAQRVNLARSTVQRIVAALEAEKLVMAASPNGRVRLGPTILRLASSVRTDFVTIARPFLAKLSGELRETVDLATIKRDHLVFIDQVIGSQRLRTVSAVGEMFPLYCTANGKAYLAGLDEGTIETLIGSVYEQRTPNTLTRINALIEDL